MLVLVFGINCENMCKFPQVSPNNKLVAYAEDTKGNEIYTVYVIDADTGAPVGQPLVNVTNYLEWAGDQALAYVTMDATLRPDKVCYSLPLFLMTCHISYTYSTSFQAVLQYI